MSAIFSRFLLNIQHKIGSSSSTCNGEIDENTSTIGRKIETNIAAAIMATGIQSKFVQISMYSYVDNLIRLAR